MRIDLHSRIRPGHKLQEISMKHSILTVWVAASIVMFAGGCNEPKPVASKVGQPLQKQTKVVAKDFVLHSRLRVTRLAANRISGGLLEVNIGLENIKKDSIWCDIQVVFYDEGGFEKEKTNWQPLLLQRRQVTFYKTRSLSSEVHDFSILLRNPRKSIAK